MGFVQKSELNCPGRADLWTCERIEPTSPSSPSPLAAGFNRRHRRAGHLFQNRFKSIVVEEERYLLELVRYIHLNPVRSRVAVALGELDAHPWTGHAVLLGNRALTTQDVDFVLAHFGSTTGPARLAYREFVHGGVDAGRTDLSGGGLRRSAGGWHYLPTLRRGRERWAYDERILGSSEFVTAVLAQEGPARVLRRSAPEVVARLCEAVADRFDVSAAQIRSRSLHRRVLGARAAVCHLAAHHLGLTVATVARQLGISKQSVMRALDRAQPTQPSWPELDDLTR